MRSDKLSAAIVTALAAVSLQGHGAAHAQVVTLGQALSAPVAQTQTEPSQQKPSKRSPASVRVDAIYGHSDDLRASVLLNGVQQEVQAGRALKAGATACRVTRIELPARCIGLAQASKEGDTCPARACWTGEAPLSPDQQPEVTQAPGMGGRELGMPPTPVPHPTPMRKQP